MDRLLVTLASAKTYAVGPNQTRTIQADKGDWWLCTDGGPLYVASSMGAGPKETTLSEGAARFAVTSTPQPFRLRDSGLSVLNETGGTVVLMLARAER